MSTKTQHHRTRGGRSTATASDAACVGSSGMHDAALCERVRELEDKVRRLEGRHDHCWHWHPYYYPTWTAPQHTWTVSDNLSTSNTIDITTLAGTNTWQS